MFYLGLTVHFFLITFKFLDIIRFDFYIWYFFLDLFLSEVLIQFILHYKYSVDIQKNVSNSSIHTLDKCRF